MKIRHIGGEGGEILVGAARCRAIVVGRWSIEDDVLEYEVRQVLDAWRAAAPRGIFRAPWGSGTREWPISGDLASGACSVTGPSAKGERDDETWNVAVGGAGGRRRSMVR